MIIAIIIIIICSSKVIQDDHNCIINSQLGIDAICVAFVF